MKINAKGPKQIHTKWEILPTHTEKITENHKQNKHIREREQKRENTVLKCKWFFLFSVMENNT